LRNWVWLSSYRSLRLKKVGDGRRWLGKKSPSDRLVGDKTRSSTTNSSEIQYKKELYARKGERLENYGGLFTVE